MSLHLLNELFESFDTVLDVEWKSSNNIVLGYFSLDNRDYLIELILTDVSEETKNFNTIIECSFKGKEKQQQKYTFIGTKTQNSSHAAKVFGTIINSVQNKIKFSDKTILYFAAKNNDNSFESRKKMYQSLTRILAKRLDLQWAFKSRPEYEVYFLSDKIISDKQIENILQHI
jgi:hypothetical protein